MKLVIAIALSALFGGITGYALGVTFGWWGLALSFPTAIPIGVGYAHLTGAVDDL